VGLGLLALPILICTNAFFCGDRRLLRQQTAPPAAAAGAKARASRRTFLFWYKKVWQQYGVPWTILPSSAR